MKSIFPWGEKIPINHIFHTSRDCLLQPNSAARRLPVTPSAASRRLHQALGKEAAGRKWQPGRQADSLCMAVPHWCLEFRGRLSAFWGRRFSFPRKNKTSMNCESQPAWKWETTQNINTLLFVFLKSQLWTKSDHFEFLCVPLFCSRGRHVTQGWLAAFSCRF